MVRMTDMHEVGKTNLLALECPTFTDKPFVAPKPLKDRKIAIVSSAGLIKRGEKPFKGGDAGYRTFSPATDKTEILVGHISVNFDRSAAIANLESVFPRETLRQMAEDGEIGAAADTHYSFMGATDPLKMEDEAKNLAATLKNDGVDTVVLLPV